MITIFSLCVYVCTTLYRRVLNAQVKLCIHVCLYNLIRHIKYFIKNHEYSLTSMSRTPDIFVLETFNSTRIRIYILCFIDKVITCCLKYSTFGSNICLPLQCLPNQLRSDAPIFSYLCAYIFVVKVSYFTQMYISVLCICTSVIVNCYFLVTYYLLTYL